MRTGVIQPLPGIGDMIWYLPALKAIAAATQDGKITLFTKASSQTGAVLGAESFIERVVALPAGNRGAIGGGGNFLATWRALARNRPDRLFILHQSPRYRWAARLAGIREIIAYAPALARSKENGWVKSLSFLREQKIPVATPHSELAVAPGAIEAARERFHAYPQPWFVIAPGASTESRLWEEKRFAACADAWVEEKGGTLFLTGSPREAARLNAIHALCHQQAHIVVVTDLGFDQIMGLMVWSTGLLGNDSGPVNVAAALGRPAFALCGVSKPALHSPHLHLITPDLPPEQGTGMQGISVPHVLSVLRAFC